MGQFLTIGIVNEIGISKEGLDAASFERLSQNLAERGFDLSLYDGKPEQNYWSGKWKQKLVEEELPDFLESAYALLGKYTRLDDSEKVLAVLENNPPGEWLEKLEEARFLNFYSDYDRQRIRFEIGGEGVEVGYRAVILKMAGKILIEDDMGLFNLLSESLQQHLQEFRLAKALRLYIAG